MLRSCDFLIGFARLLCDLCKIYAVFVRCLLAFWVFCVVCAMLSVSVLLLCDYCCVCAGFVFDFRKVCVVCLCGLCGACAVFV